MIFHRLRRAAMLLPILAALGACAAAPCDIAPERDGGIGGTGGCAGGPVVMADPQGDVPPTATDL